jgi:hypothetical protein
MGAGSKPAASYDPEGTMTITQCFRNVSETPAEFPVYSPQTLKGSHYDHGPDEKAPEERHVYSYRCPLAPFRSSVGAACFSTVHGEHATRHILFLFVTNGKHSRHEPARISIYRNPSAPPKNKRRTEGELLGFYQHISTTRFTAFLNDLVAFPAFGNLPLQRRDRSEPR